LTFLLGKLGTLAASRFAARLAPRGLTPRHCSVLEFAAAQPLSQLDLAERIGVTPSVVVDMLDELESLGAVRRVPDPADRRRRLVELTPEGDTLRQFAARAAHEVDAELFDPIPSAVRRSLTELGARHGLGSPRGALGSPGPEV
jgi:DNA-binding MarR family transcriptional regulator